MAHEILIAPSSLPISLEEVRSYLRIGTSEDDGILSLFNKSATDKIENKYHQALVTRTMRERFYGPDIQKAFNLAAQANRKAYLRPYFAPVSSMVLVKFFDEIGAITNAPNGFIKLENNKFYISNLAYGIEIDYVCGFGNSAKVPNEYKQLILEEIANSIAKRDNEKRENNPGELSKGAQL